MTKPCRSTKRCSIKFTEPSMTHQNLAPECNINNIIKKYTDTGIVSHINSQTGQYGDFSNIGTYQESLDQIKIAESLFMELPADTRKFFDNDPVHFVTYCENPQNYDKLVELGLATAKPVHHTSSAPEPSNQPTNSPDKEAQPKTTPN